MTDARHSDTLRIVAHNGGTRWQVFDGDQPASVIYEKIESAMARLERLQRKARIKPRPCLRCGISFPSDGAHNRLCDSCRSYAASMHGAMA